MAEWTEIDVGERLSSRGQVSTTAACESRSSSLEMPMAEAEVVAKRKARL